MFLKDHIDLLRKYIDYNEDIYETKWLMHNIFNYRKGLFIFMRNSMFQIENILVNNFNYYFLCAQFDFVDYDKFLNSIRIQRRQPVHYSVVKFSCLANKTAYENQVLEEKNYIILDNLDLKNYFPTSQ